MLTSALFASDIPQPDTSYRSKTLDNGFTYYIKKNSFPENRASLRLFVKAGSLHEEDHQQGLAHFLEHMLFRGSENFEDWEVINFLESIGAQFGPDTNAFTSFDRTVYMLELPLEKEGVLDKGILICSDWASSAKIENGLVEKERAVVADEYNISMKQCSTRQFKKIFDTFLSKSLYNRRWPIGKKDIVLNCDPQVIRDFYNKWYRADRMALVAVGDFDEDLVEEMIVKNFSKLKKPTEEVVEPDTSLFLPEDSHFEVYQDDEQSMNIGMLWSLFDHEEEDGGEPKEITRKAVEKSIFKAIFERSLNQRLERLGKSHPAPFAAQFPMNFDIARLGVRGIGFAPFEKRPCEGMTSILREIVRILTFGPSNLEFSDIITSLKQEVVNEIANIDRVTHAAIAQDLMDHFMDNTPVYTYLERLEYKLTLLNEIQRDQLVNWLKEGKFEPFRHAIFQVSDDDFITPNEMQESVAAWVKEDVFDQEEVHVVELKSVERTHSEDTSYEKIVDEKNEFTTLVLNNGMKVILQSTQLEKDEISLIFFAKGGKASLQPELLPVVDYLASEYVKNAGFANFSGEDLERYLAREKIAINSAVHLNQRSLVLSSSNSENMGNLFTLAHGLFHERKRDENAWNSLIARMSEFFKNWDKNPNMYFSKYVSEHFYNNHPAFRFYLPSDAKEEAAVAVVDTLFSDPKEFTLLVIGDFNVEEAEKLAVNFFSSKSKKKSEVLVEVLSGATPVKDEDITVYRGLETPCVNQLFYTGPFSYEYKGDMGMTAAAFDHILSHRLLEKIRKEMGDTYSIRFGTGFPLSPNQDTILMSVNFGCEPEKADNLKKIVKEHIALFIEEGPNDEEIETAKGILLERERVAMLSNAAYVGAHMTAEIFSTSFGAQIDYVTRIERQVSKERLEAFAKAAFGEGMRNVCYTLKSEDQE